MQATATDDAGIRRRARAARLFGLYAVTPDVADTASLVASVGAAISGGAAAVQYRNKTADQGLRRAQAAALARVHAIRGALYIVNDDAALAAEMDADGVHIGRTTATSPPPGRASAPTASSECPATTSSRAPRPRSRRAPITSLSAASSRPRSSLPRAAPISRCSSGPRSGVPVVAIGGIDATNADALRVAGADAVAVISALFGAPDVESAARALARIYEPL